MKRKSLSEVIRPDERDAIRMTARSRARGAAFAPQATAPTEGGVRPTAYRPEDDALIDKLIKPQTIETPFGALPFGFILFIGPPDSSKSLTALALCFYINSFFPRTSGLARYVAVSEPHADASPGTATEKIMKNIQNLPSVIPDILDMKKVNNKTPNVLVIDSIVEAMRSFAVDKQDKDKGTMAGGMERSDQLFCSACQAVARPLCTLIGVAGSADIPFIDSLEGRVEGIMTSVGGGQFTLKVRGKISRSDSVARTEEVFAVPAWAFQAALLHMGYISKLGSTVQDMSPAPDVLKTFTR